MCRPTNTARGQVTTALLSWLSVLTLIAGCGSTGGRDFTLASSSRDDMAIAMSDHPADMRRIAATRVAESRNADSAWAREGFTSIALLDGDTQTRCVALRALGTSDDPNATLTIVAVLRRAAQPNESVREPSGITRWDAAKVLADRLEKGDVLVEHLPIVVAVFGERLQNDSSKHVRSESARGLGYCVGEFAVFDPLFDGLADDEFSVVYACENALIALTGITHEADEALWRAWYANNQDNPFDSAGQTPESLQRSKWRERWRHTKRFMGMEQ